MRALTHARAALSLTPAPAGAPVSNYGISKFLQVYHARELAVRETGLLAFSLHPGFVNTSMTKVMSPATIREWCALQGKPCPLTAEMGASTQTYLAAASDAELAGSSGAFFTQCATRRPPEWDAASQGELFDKSLAWTRSGAHAIVEAW